MDKELSTNGHCHTSNGFITAKTNMYFIRKGQNVGLTITVQNMQYSSWELLFNCYKSCSDRSQLRANEHQRINTGYLQDAKLLKTGQTANKCTSNVHPLDIFIWCHPFKVFKMSKSCQWIRPDKTDITSHGTHSPHEERTRMHANRHERTENFTVR